MLIFKYKSFFTFIGVFFLLVAAAPAHASTPLFYNGLSSVQYDTGGILSVTSGSVVNSGTASDLYVVMKSGVSGSVPISILIKDNGNFSCGTSIGYTGTPASLGYTGVFGQIIDIPLVPRGTGSNCVFTSGDTFQFLTTGLGDGSNPDLATDAPSGGNSLWAVTDGSGSPFVPAGDTCITGNDGVCIDSVTPPDDPTYVSPLATSTSFTFGATGYVPNATVGQTVTISVRNNTQQAQISSVAFFSNQNYDAPYTKTFTFPVFSGSFSFSTTTNVQQIGQYTLVTSISSPNPSFWGDIYNWLNVALGQSATANQAVSTTTVFLVSTSTTYDLLTNAVTAQAQALASTTQFTSDVCNIFSGSFDVGNCASYLLIPDDNSIIQAYTNFQNGFLSRAPWGYVTRFMVVMSTTTATTTLPNLTIGMPSQVNGIPFPITGNTLSINVFGNLMSTTSFLGTATSSDNRTFRQVVEPYWDWSWGIIGVVALLYLLIHH